MMPTGSRSALQSLITTVAPSVEPVTVEQAKQYARIGFGDDDNLIAGFISEARQWVERMTSRALLTQTLQGVWTLPKSPEAKLRGLYAALGMELTFWLPRTPLQSVTTAEIEIDLNVWQTLRLTSDYVVDTSNDPARVWLRASAISYWAPTGALINFMGVYAPRVRITYEAGYGNGSGAVPQAFQTAIMAYVAWRYDNRAGGTPPESILIGLDAIRNV